MDNSTLRYAEMDAEVSGADDFIVRNRNPAILYIIGAFLGILFVSLTLVVYTSNKYMLAALLITVVTVVGWYLILQIQRNNDLLLATEFQNALFASALGLNNKFCIIIRRDGNIVYLDRPFQQMFPEFLRQPGRTLDILFEQGKVSKPEVDKIYSAIERGVFEKVIFNIRGAGKRYYKIVMSVEPILRPAGFIMLRGREFVEQRTTTEEGENAPVTLLSNSTITLFAHIMDTMNMGVYMTDPNGQIVYANPVLEKWLEFDDGEIGSNNLSIRNLIQHSQENVREIEPADFEGEVMLQKKTGGLVKCYMNQKIIRDEEQKLMGCTAIIHNISETTKEMKKKLW